MTPEQAAYFNAGLEAARKFLQREIAHGLAAELSALSVRTDLIAVPRDEEAIALVLYNQYRKRCHMHPVDHIGANMTPACEQCREDARAMISAWENRS